MSLSFPGRQIHAGAAPSLEGAWLPGLGRSTLEARQTSSISESALVQITVLLLQLGCCWHSSGSHGSRSGTAHTELCQQELVLPVGNSTATAKFCLLHAAARVSLSSRLLVGSLSPDTLGTGPPRVPQN